MSVVTTSQAYAEQTTEELFQTYTQTHQEDVKWEIVLRYSNLVKMMAAQLRDVYSRFTQMDDVINEGLIVLAETVDKYDPEKGRFDTFAFRRLRGMVFDLAKKQDWVASSVRKRVQAIDRTAIELTNALGRAPTDQEVAEHLGLSMAQCQKALGIAFTHNVLSLEELLEENSEHRIVNHSADSAAIYPEHALQRQELLSVLAETISSLSENEQKVLSLYYQRELMMKEIASVMGVSIVRVSQLHTKALQKLRKQMATYLEESREEQSHV